MTAPDAAAPLRGLPRTVLAACVLLALAGLAPMPAWAQIETLPTVEVAPGPTPVTEGTDATFTVTRTGVTTGALTVHYRVSETGGDRVTAADEGAKTISFSGNAASVTVTVPVESDDDTEEADSVVTAMLTPDAAYELGAPTSAAVTVEDDDFISNIDDDVDGSSGWSVRNGRTYSQPFVTGSVAGGYRLHSVVLHFSHNTLAGSGHDIDRETLKVTLRKNGSGGAPGNTLHTLTNPSSLNRIGENKFAAPAGVILAANTRYHIALEYPSDTGNPALSSSGAAASAVAGWNIPNTRYEF